MNMYGVYRFSHLKGDLVEVETVTHVVVRTHSLWVVVHHYGLVPHLWKQVISYYTDIWRDQPIKKNMQASQKFLHL